MLLNKKINILIVGLGLMGGSYAKSLHRKGYRVEAITKEQSSIDYATQNDIIDFGTTEADPDVISRADLVIFALYPGAFAEWIEANQKHFKSGAVLTDVTGVKCGVVDKIQGILRPDVEFIAAHPMAGKEVYGVENSDDKIFRDANYIVVPTEKNTEEAIQMCEQLGWVLGFNYVARLSPEEHDEMIAYLSQLTHCIAVTLMCCHDNGHLVNYTGDSFRDLTRIAKINDEMWSELFMMNRERLLSQMDLFIDKFRDLRQNLEDGDREAMREMMRTSTRRRLRFDKK